MRGVVRESGPPKVDPRPRWAVYLLANGSICRLLMSDWTPAGAQVLRDRLTESDSEYWEAIEKRRRGLRDKPQQIELFEE